MCVIIAGDGTLGVWRVCTELTYINTYITVETFLHPMLVSENRECGKACIQLYNFLYKLSTNFLCIICFLM